MDYLIKNGTIVTASERYKGDIKIEDGKIVLIGENLKADGAEVIDAAGKYVMPGGIDAHTHLDMPFGGTFSSDDFETGTKAAAIGGTTALLDYAVQPADKSLADTAKIWRDKADGKAVIDYGLHVAITHTEDEVMNELPDMVDAGYTSYKVFMVYDGMRVDDESFIKILTKASEAGAIIGVHAENYYIIKYLVNKFLEEGKTDPLHHGLSRPAICEGEAANRAITLAEVSNAPLYIVHSSCEESVEQIKLAREKGLPIMGETCPQYLLLSLENYKEPDFNGAKYVMSPPLREKCNWDYLWTALRTGVLQTVATDHCPFFMEQKRMGEDDFSKIPNGAPGIEARIPIMLSEGQKHGLSMERLVELMSTNPAKIFGMYPEKGTISVGSDADLFIYDPDKEVTITKEILHENVDYTPFEGLEVKGYPVLTMSRGEVIAKDGEFVGEDGRGQFLKRKPGMII